MLKMFIDVTISEVQISVRETASVNSSLDLAGATSKTAVAAKDPQRGGKPADLEGDGCRLQGGLYKLPAL